MENKTFKDLQKVVRGSKNALQEMADRLKINPDTLKKVLKATVIRGTFDKKTGEYILATDEEFIAFIAVANAYKLNPLTKEIYAFPDPKSGRVIPIVSTDGWNRMMIENRFYKSHSYTYSEKTKKMPNSRECYEWIECVIVRRDETIVVIREHLDECFRDLPYANPWQTHPKRMLRHKTKIQAAREAFGFAGIYDRDEAERISEMTPVEMIEPPPEEQNKKEDRLLNMAKKAKKQKEQCDKKEPDEKSVKLNILQEQIHHAQYSIKKAACEKLGFSPAPDWLPKTKEDCQKLINEINRLYKDNQPE